MVPIVSGYAATTVPDTDRALIGERVRRAVARHLIETRRPSGKRATIVATTTAEPLRSVRDHLSEVVDRVQHHHERVVITRNGHDAAVVISPEDLAQLEETIAVLSDQTPWPTSARPAPPTSAVTSFAASKRSAGCTVTDEEPYELVVTPPARRALTDQLPEPVVAAVIGFSDHSADRKPRPRREAAAGRTRRHLVGTARDLPGAVPIT